MEAAPTPISIPSLITSLIGIVSELQRKNTTMINYYIYPRPIPTEIVAYEPRILILRTRIANLSQLSIPILSCLIDDAVALVASYLLPNVQQLAVASMSIQRIFIEHYDRRLEQSLPYDTIHETLRHFEQAIHQFMAMQMNNPRRQPAENHIPPPSSTGPSLCRGAIAFLNNRDHGKVSSVLPNDLLPQHQGRLADQGGVILWWECPTCAFRLRYHGSHSMSLNVNQTDEVMVEDSVEQIAHRSAWLVKCHIYHPRQPAPVPVPSPPMSPRSPKVRGPEPLTPKPPPPLTRRPSAPPKRVSFTRRRTSSSSTVTLTTSARVITRSPSPHATKKHKSKSKPQPKSSPEPTGPRGLKYYCPFCVAKGMPLLGPPPEDTDDSSSDDAAAAAHRDVTCFEDSRGLMEHIEDRHTRDRPVNLLLQKLKVAVLGEMAPGVDARQRWDLDIRL